MNSVLFLTFFLLSSFSLDSEYLDGYQSRGGGPRESLKPPAKPWPGRTFDPETEVSKNFKDHTGVADKPGYVFNTTESTQSPSRALIFTTDTLVPLHPSGTLLLCTPILRPQHYL